MELALEQANFSDVDALAIDETSRAWLYREQLREILQRKQVNVVREMLKQ